MSTRRWSNVSYLDAIRPDPGWHTEYAFLASYSADLVAMVAALLALAGLDDDRGSGSKVDFANAVDQLKDRVRLIAQAGRLVAPAKPPKILAILDRYVREVNSNETEASWHPKAALAKLMADDGKSTQWRLWIGSRNLTRDLSWDIGLSLIGRVGADLYSEIIGIPEFGHALALHARLPAVPPGTVKSELRRVRWDVPAGCVIRRLELLNNNLSRGLPSEPPKVHKLIVVSPFLDGAIVGQLAKWGDASTHRTLLSSRPELAKLASQTQKPLCGFHELLFLDVPLSDEQSANDVSERQNAASQDEEPEPRGLHAKLIYAEGVTHRLVWTGSANATQRGWNGPNSEIVAELEVTHEIAAGLEDFVKSATTVRLDELVTPVEVDEIDERLEKARTQVAGCWSVTQQRNGDEHLLSSLNDPNPTDPEVQLSIGLLGTAQLPWPRGTTILRLPRIAAIDVTELLSCRLTLGDLSMFWLQRAPIDPPPNDERDHQALARYLNPRMFLLWIRALLTGAPARDGGGDWDDDDRTPSRMPSHAAPAWWAPTIEEVLKAWSRDPTSLVLIDKKVRHYLKLYQEQTDIEQTAEERSVVEEFHKTWQILRQKLVLDAR
jgi:hypothetical protein